MGGKGNNMNDRIHQSNKIEGNKTKNNHTNCSTGSCRRSTDNCCSRDKRASNTELRKAWMLAGCTRAPVGRIPEPQGRAQESAAAERTWAQAPSWGLFSIGLTSQ